MNDILIFTRLCINSKNSAHLNICPLYEKNGLVVLHAGFFVNDALPSVHQIESFLSKMLPYLFKEIEYVYLFQLKRKELVFIIHMYYPAKNLASFFYTLICLNTDYKYLMLRNFFIQNYRTTNCYNQLKAPHVSTTFQEKYRQTLLAIYIIKKLTVFTIK